jgi:hypothetical protein
MTWHQSMGHKGPALWPRCTETKRAQTQLLLYSVISKTDGPKYVSHIIIHRKNFFILHIYIGKNIRGSTVMFETLGNK